MRKNLLLIIIAIVLVAGALFVVYYFNKSKPDPNGIILFYSDGCPHCLNVDKFIKENKVEEKVKFERLEVFYNQDNAKILLEKAQFCGIKTDDIGVPFLWDGQNCIMGDQDIIKFFNA